MERDIAKKGGRSDEALLAPIRSISAEGIGLGLWLSRHIVERQGGSISAQSGTPGAVFTVRLPRADAHTDAPT